MKLIRQVAFQLTGVILTMMIWRRFGLLGLLVAMPIAFAGGWYWAAAKQR